jgi:hypothetical protein
VNIIIVDVTITVWLVFSILQWPAPWRGVVAALHQDHGAEGWRNDLFWRDPQLTFEKLCRIQKATFTGFKSMYMNIILRING